MVLTIVLDYKMFLVFDHLDEAEFAHKIEEQRPRVVRITCLVSLHQRQYGPQMFQQSLLSHSPFYTSTKSAGRRSEEVTRPSLLLVDLLLLGRSCTTPRTRILSGSIKHPDLLPSFS